MPADQNLKSFEGSSLRGLQTIVTLGTSEARISNTPLSLCSKSPRQVAIS